MKEVDVFSQKRTIADRVRDLETHMVAVKHVLPSHENQIDLSAQSIAELHGKVDTLTDNFEILSNTVGTLTGNVAALTGTVNTLTTTVNSLAGNVDLILEALNIRKTGRV